MTSYDLIDILEAYSRRPFMYRYSVGVRVIDLVDSLKIGYAIGKETGVAGNLPTTEFDELDRGYVLYWPRMKWPSDVSEGEY